MAKRTLAESWEAYCSDDGFDHIDVESFDDGFQQRDTPNAPDIEDDIDYDAFYNR